MTAPHSAPGINPSRVINPGNGFAERVQQDFFCPSGHDFLITLAAQASIPSYWECPTCSALATQTPFGEVENPDVRADRSHWEQVAGRRSDAELEDLLNGALGVLRATHNPAQR